MDNNVERRKWRNCWLRSAGRRQMRRFALFVLFSAVFSGWLGVGGPPFWITHYVSHHLKGPIQSILNQTYRDTLSGVHTLTGASGAILHFDDQMTFDSYQEYRRLLEHGADYYLNTMAVCLFSLIVWQAFKKLRISRWRYQKDGEKGSAAIRWDGKGIVKWIRGLKRPRIGNLFLSILLVMGVSSVVNLAYWAAKPLPMVASGHLVPTDFPTRSWLIYETSERATDAIDLCRYAITGTQLTTRTVVLQAISGGIFGSLLACFVLALHWASTRMQSRFQKFRSLSSIDCSGTPALEGDSKQVSRRFRRIIAAGNWVRIAAPKL
ncbi:MAG: hypothetical protein AB7N71_14675 [Phycisphaerae bacterium]